MYLPVVLARLLLKEIVAKPLGAKVPRNAESIRMMRLGFGPGKTAVSAIETAVPAWIGAGQEAAWGIGVSPALTLGMSEFKVYDGGIFEVDKSRRLRGELMELVAKHLPNKAYMYVPSLRNEKGDRTPAYIADNQKKHLFVMPQSAQVK